MSFRLDPMSDKDKEAESKADSAYDLNKKKKPSRLKKILNKNKSLRDFMVLYEVLKPPQGIDSKQF